MTGKAPHRRAGPPTRCRRSAGGGTEAVRAGLRRARGIGPAGADIFVREVLAVRPEAAETVREAALARK
ncbi:hypothetical protein [Streptomyces parvus]|uniref:hypothetical protein n=1 Tax=Streptomyces parvus TaxID=66428 RepID=UPI0035E176F9